MKTFLTLFVLFFSSSVVADDISDFQIEGMSIGDSLLDYFNEEERKKGKIISYPKSKEFSTFRFWEPTFDFEMYDSIGISFKTNDKNYQIVGMAGAIFYKKNIEDCYKKKDEITKELSGIFKNAEKLNQKASHPVDVSGKSKTVTTYFNFKSGGVAKVGCADYSKEFEEKRNRTDHMQISIYSDVYADFLTDEAY